MSADDQHFLDVVLSHIPRELRQYSENVAEYIDTNVDRAAGVVRESLSQAKWLPEYIKPSPPPKPSVASVAMTRLDKAQDWMMRHKFLTGAMVFACGTVVLRAYQANRSLRKTRKAKRAKNGGRTEVVVIAGSPSLPLTKSLSLDMEKRGFIVYIVCSAREHENLVHGLGRPDIRSLRIDTTDPPRAGAAIEGFASYLQKPSVPGPQVRPNHLTLKSVILIPSLHYQTSPIATIPPSSFADLFNTHLLQPILTIQAFLPLLTTRLQPVGEKWTPPKVLVLTPSIISSINPPFHAPEATVCSALSAFTEVLTAELRPLDIPVTHMQLGTFDFSGFTPASSATAPPTAAVAERKRPAIASSLSASSSSSSSRSQSKPSAAAAAARAGGGGAVAGNVGEPLTWPDDARHIYGRNYVAQTRSAISGKRIRGFRKSSLRCLHHAVFDVMDGSVRADSVRVGLGASIYGFVGRWAPRGLVSWMMGVRRVDELSAWKTSSSREGSERDYSDDTMSHGGPATPSSNDFVAVPSERNVWGADTADSRFWNSQQL